MNTEQTSEKKILGNVKKLQYLQCLGLEKKITFVEIFQILLNLIRNIVACI